MITHPLAILLLRYRLVIILGATLILGGLFIPGYLSFSTLALSLDRGTTMGIIAVGMTAILISARIDLSSGSILAASGIVMVMLQPVIGAWPAVAVGIGVGGAFGLLNGLIVVRLGINAMIATLASMLAIRSIAHLITGSLPVNGQDWAFGAALTGDLVGGFSSRVVIFLVLVAALHIWLTYIPAGRGLYAVGSNESAARENGINVDTYILGAFVFAGLCAGLSGVLLSLNVNTGSPVFGVHVLIQAIMAVVMGGTRLEGGRGSALGTLGGVVTVSALTTALEYASVASHIQQIVMGLILITLIVMDHLASMSRSRRLLPSRSSA